MILKSADMIRLISSRNFAMTYTTFVTTIQQSGYLCAVNEPKPAHIGAVIS
jgi:hypothetical protein